MDEHQLDLTAEPEVGVTATNSRRNWALSHPYISALVGAGVLVVAAAFLIVRGTPAPSGTRPVAWGGAGTFFSGSPQPLGSSELPSIAQETVSAPPYTYTLPNLQPGNSQSGGEQAADGFDFNAFIALLSVGSEPKPSPSSSSSVQNAYAFIPTGLVSAQVPAKRTPLQGALYQYGNDVGSFIQSFEQEHPNAAKVLWDQAQDRADAGKASALASFAQSFTSLGNTLAGMDDVPSQTQSAHDALTESYRDLGQKLAAVPGIKTDADFLASVNAYNASVEIFTKRYVALANLFVAYGVSFAQGDPGSVFTFTNTAL